MRDALLPLIPAGTVITGAATGTTLDLLKGTNVQKDGIAGTDLLGQPNIGNNALSAVIDVSAFGGTSSPVATFQLSQSDDNSTFTSLATATASANGETLIPFNPTKRYIRLDVTAFTGTSPTLTADAYVGTRPF